MAKITFIIGGARSGKSSFALQLARKSKNVVFIATALALDKEMKVRIAKHKAERPYYWELLEEPVNLDVILKKVPLWGQARKLSPERGTASVSVPRREAKSKIVIIDCLTLWVSNLLFAGFSDKAIEGKVENVLKIIKAQKNKYILVSNEVGLGIVPNNYLGRRFRDLIGVVNRKIAQKANRVVFMVSGMPLNIKS